MRACAKASARAEGCEYEWGGGGCCGGTCCWLWGCGACGGRDSPWESVEDAEDEEVDEPWMELFIHESGDCCCSPLPPLTPPSSSEEEEESEKNSEREVRGDEL